MHTFDAIVLFSMRVTGSPADGLNSPQMLTAWQRSTFVPSPGGFDLVLVCYLQLPAPDLAGVLHRAATAVAPGGAFLLVAHDRRNLTDGVGGPQDPAVLTRADEVVPHLSGLTVVEAGEVERPVETEEGPRTAIDTLVVAHRDPSPR